MTAADIWADSSAQHLRCDEDDYGFAQAPVQKEMNNEWPAAANKAMDAITLPIVPAIDDGRSGA
jgi:hypothetical protein